MTNKLIILHGDRYYYCGDTKVVGSDWVYSHDLTVTICCDCLSSLHIFKEIPFNVFMFCLSRMRSREAVVHKRGDKAGVFANLEGLWFDIDREQIIDWKDYQLDKKVIEDKWNEYWSEE